MDEGHVDRTSDAEGGTAPFDNTPAPTPPGVVEPPRAAPASSGGNADAMASLRNATAGLESALAPVEKALAPLQGLVAPLEPVGKQIMALIGAVILFVGTFLSVRSASASYAGITIVSVSQNLWNYAGFTATIVTLSAILAAGAAALRMYAWLWIAAAASLVFLLISFLFSFGSPWGPSWGWIVLLIGLLALLSSAAMRDTGKTII
jgi:hypothetical protein